ncbi:MAG: metallophosphoesterase, partial [Methanobrevibacter sp.]|nr:metallophosphoesterase [Methanobrevibacter sp.]
MKILAISDVHGKKSESLINYLKKNDDISLVLIAGDITDFSITEFEPLSFVKPFIDELVEECDVDVFAIPGNCDPAGICNAIKESGPDEKPAFCLHNQLIAYENAVIMGYGGSNPTPFN